MSEKAAVTWIATENCEETVRSSSLAATNKLKFFESKA